MNELRHIQLLRTPFPKFVPNTYTFKPESKFNIWQRIALWVLREFKNPHFEEQIQIDSVEVDRARFMDKVFSMERAVHEISMKRPEWLIIGAEDFAEIMGSKEIQQIPFRFDAEYRMKRAEYEQAKVCGLRVFVLPWVRGMFVTPDLTKGVL